MHDLMDYRDLLPLAAQGTAAAQHQLGVMYAKVEGVDVNDAEAVKWYRKAAEQGFAKAQSSLGTMYYNGRVVPENRAEAAKWWRKAAGQGHTQAQLILGRLYYAGVGVPVNNVKAYMWWSLAKAQGDLYFRDGFKWDRYEAASTNLDMVKELMTPADISKAQALAAEMWKKY